MFERKLLTFFSLFFIGFFSFFVFVSSTYAVTCGGVCGGSFVCNAPLWCDAGICHQVYAECPTACGAAASNQLDAACGVHACPAVPIPTRGACSAVCGTAASTLPDGACGTYDCPGNPDTSPPAIPVGATTFIPDDICKETYKAKYEWNAVADVGCAGLNTTPYWAQGSIAGDFSSVLYGWDNTWGSATSQTSATAYPPGTPLYFHVQSRDSFDNQSGWSATDTIIVPLPSPYPTIHVEGPLSEDINRTCYPMSLLRDLTLEPVIVPAAGVTPICTMPTTDSYSCNFTIDNQKGLCVNPQINVTMNSTYSGYGTIGWRTGAGGGECTGDPTSRDFTAGDSEANVPIYLSYSAIIPTVIPTEIPLPTVTPGGPTLTPTPIVPTSIPLFAAGWFKLKDATFNSRMSNRTNYIPRTITLFDTTNEDSISDHSILIGSAGALLQNGLLQPGANAYVNDVISYSKNNWYTNGYVSSNSFGYTKYLDYLKARKEYKTIEGTLSAASFPTDGIYSYIGNTTIDPTWFNGKTIVLIIQGTTTIAGDFIPTNGTLALLSSFIDIQPDVAEIQAILIGERVSTGISDTIPLKIKGNLIDEEAGGMIIGRSRTNGTKPSLFVVFDPQKYLNIAPYLSTSTYDWRQIQ